jgi:hypothetical protein
MLHHYYDLFDNFLATVQHMPDFPIPMPLMSFQLRSTLYTLYILTSDMVTISHPASAPAAKQHFQIRLQYTTYTIHNKCRTIATQHYLTRPQF